MISVGCEYLEILTKGIKHIQKLGLADAEQRYQHVLWASSVTFSKSAADLNQLHTRTSCLREQATAR